MSSLKFLLNHGHSPLKDRSKCIVLIESISDTPPLLMTGNLARRGLEIGRKPEGGAVRNHLYSAPSRDHTQLYTQFGKVAQRRHNNVTSTGELKRHSLQ